MKAVTVRNLPSDLANVIRRRARERGLSLNKTIITMLQESLGGRTHTSGSYHDLDELFGTWAPQEAEAFERSLRGQRQVDPEVWR